jgi:hypothetical protein
MDPGTLVGAAASVSAGPRIDHDAMILLFHGPARKSQAQAYHPYLVHRVQVMVGRALRAVPAPVVATVRYQSMLVTSQQRCMWCGI